jgi:hypothetical protein
MAGTLTIDTLQDGSSNSSSVTDVVKGSARAWVNFNGTGTVAIRAAYNVSSITDSGTGRYGANFTNALSDSNYSAVTVNANRDGGCYSYTTTSVAIFSGETPVDSSDISLAIFGN